ETFERFLDTREHLSASVRVFDGTGLGGRFENFSAFDLELDVDAYHFAASDFHGSKRTAVLFRNGAERHRHAQHGEADGESSLMMSIRTVACAGRRRTERDRVEPDIEIVHRTGEIESEPGLKRYRQIGSRDRHRLTVLVLQRPRHRSDRAL